MVSFKADIYRLLFETASEGLILCNEKRIIEFVNPRVSEIFGYKSDELIGNTIEVLLPEDTRKAHQSHFGGYAKQPERKAMGAGRDLYGRTKKGKLVPLEISINFLEHEEKKWFVALITDITQRKKSESKLIDTLEELKKFDKIHQDDLEKIKMLNSDLEKRVEERTSELKESQKLHQEIARNFPSGTINVFDENLNYVFVEGQELYKLGVTSEKLMGTNYLKRLDKSISKNIEARLRKVFEGQPETFEIEFKDNFYVINAVPLPDGKGKIPKILVVEKNITAMRKATLEMEKALEKERELNELKSRFVSMASHEFRTPLSTILSSVALIEKYNTLETLEKKEKHVNRIRNSVGSLTSILNDFLSLEKLEAGKVSANKTWFSIEECCHDLVEEMQAVAKTGQKITVSKKGKTNEIFSDKNLLRNVMINLISNAIKYSPENKTISINIKENKKELQVEVQDQGIGIPKEEQKMLFDRFFRASNSVNIQGTGLGLNIVKKYLDLIEGRITFASKFGEGTSFIVSFDIEKLTHE